MHIGLCPSLYWIKCNTHGTFRGSRGISICGGTFKSRLGTFIGAFSANIDIATSLHPEIRVAAYSNIFSHSRGCNPIWIECDSLNCSRVI